TAPAPVRAGGGADLFASRWRGHGTPGTAPSRAVAFPRAPGARRGLRGRRAGRALRGGAEKGGSDGGAARPCGCRDPSGLRPGGPFRVLGLRGNPQVLPGVTGRVGAGVRLRRGSRAATGEGCGRPVLLDAGDEFLRGGRLDEIADVLIARRQRPPPAGGQAEPDGPARIPAAERLDLGRMVIGGKAVVGKHRAAPCMWFAEPELRP